MTEEQLTRLAFLRKDLAVWEERRRRARWSLAADRLYNCSAMDEALGELAAELNQLEKLVERQPTGKRRKSHVD